jgi:FKBP-type peptidyl-prolyl cis-trans isomerase
MTRRFGLKGGLAWLGVLTFGVVSEQVKTRRETREAIENTRDVDARERREVATPSGASYVELVVGGGERVAPQYLCAAHVRVTNTSTGEVVFDTRAKGRQVVWSYGGRLGGAITRGVEDGVAGMRQGGRRVIKVPAALAFGDDGAVLGDAIVRPGTDLTYDVELTRVSIPPS